MTTRNELEHMVIACNFILRPRVEKMSNVELLRNVHPAYRQWFTSQLYNEGKLSRTKAMEFNEYI